MEYFSCRCVSLPVLRNDRLMGISFFFNFFFRGLKGIDVINYSFATFCVASICVIVKLFLIERSFYIEFLCVV